MAAPILLVFLRVLQGLALGGEYGGAAIYVAEHAPRNKRGFYTSFIQAGVIGGFLLSRRGRARLRAVRRQGAVGGVGLADPLPLLAGAARRLAVGAPEAQGEPGLPGDEGSRARSRKNPLKESFDSRANVKLVLVALFGIAAGLTVIWYTAQFQAMYFLQNSLRIEDTAARR